MTTSQLTTVETLGMINYEQGVNRVPAQSKELMNILAERQVGKTPKGEAKTSELMTAWVNGWDKAKRIEMKERFGF